MDSAEATGAEGSQDLEVGERILALGDPGLTRLTRLYLLLLLSLLLGLPLLLRLLLLSLGVMLLLLRRLQ